MTCVSMEFFKHLVYRFEVRWILWRLHRRSARLSKAEL
jgi:hypothetical protein